MGLAEGGRGTTSPGVKLGSGERSRRGVGITEAWAWAGAGQERKHRPVRCPLPRVSLTSLKLGPDPFWRRSVGSAAAELEGGGEGSERGGFI